MKKINKMNVNGEVYDIQDNSSGYVKGTEISDLVNQLVDEKVAEFLKAGFNTETVDELPTENISYKTIYLVPSQKSEEENIYDEYIYTSKDEWEMIGSTKTDLSNYYTKEEVDNAIENIDIPTSIDRLELPSYSSISAEKLAELQTIISKHFVDKTSILLELKIGTNVSCLLFGQTSSVFAKNGTVFYFEPLQPIALDALHYANSIYDMVVYCKVNDDETDCIVSRAECRQRPRKQFLSKDNTEKFIPTQPYHPSTKKYVDDSISNALGDVNTILATLTTVEEEE